jgi:hypothetical protein
MFLGQQAFIVTFICPAGWSPRCVPSSLTDFWRINTWLLHGIDSTLMWIFDSFSLSFFHSLPLSDCLCTRELPESFSACIHLWIQYSCNTCHFTGRASSEFFATLGSATNSFPPLRYCSQFHISPLRTYYSLCSLHVANIIKYGHYYQLFFIIEWISWVRCV